MRETILEDALRGMLDPRTVLRAVRRPDAPSLLLDSGGSGPEGWEPLVALAPRALAASELDLDRGPAGILSKIDGLVAARRREGGPSGTGLAVLLGYEALAERGGAPEFPHVVALAVDDAIRFPKGEPPVVVHRAAPGPTASSVESLVARLGDRADEADVPEGGEPSGGRPSTSLPREAYLRAVTRIQARIRAGDVYQANLTQRLEVPWSGDPFRLYRGITAAAVAPRAAFLEVPGLFALASASPETFVRVDRDGHIETWPIKGTRPRGRTQEEDDAAARELLASEKDRAELLMIVDLERNDLGRVCRPGSIEVPELFALRSFPAVHHLVARVRGELRSGAGVREILRATFPGGSITGAPKRSAIEILSGLEPVPRGFYTGSLLWFGDDGTTESSILIRTIVIAGGRAYVGAGGGVVADSDPDAEWRESNHKAEALTRALGFAPEEAS